MNIYPPPQPASSSPDDVSDQEAAYRALGGDPDSRKIDVPVAGTTYASTQLTPGAYRVWLMGGSASDALSVALAASAASPSIAAIATTAGAYDTWRANLAETVRVTAALPFLWVRTATGIGTVYLSRVGP